MLTKKQWQWMADHYLAIRVTFCLVIAVALAGYIFLLGATILAQGKWRRVSVGGTTHLAKFDCAEKLAPYAMGPFGGNKKSAPEYYSDANLFLLERHYTSMWDADALFQHPECIGAMLSDTADDPDPSVILIYDRDKKRVIYRLAQINDVLKR